MLIKKMFKFKFYSEIHQILRDKKVIRFYSDKGSLGYQLKEQGYRFIGDLPPYFFNETLKSIENLFMYGFVTQTEYMRIRNRFFKHLEKYVTKIEE